MERERRDWQLGSWEWLREAAKLPSRPQPLNGISGPLSVMTGRCIVVGFSANNTATTAGRLDIIDGQDGSGILAWRQGFPAGTVTNGSLPGRGVLLDLGCFVNVTTANLFGSILLIPLWDYEFTPPGH